MELEELLFLPHSFQLLLQILVLSLADKYVFVLCRTSLQLQKGIKLQYPSLAACPAFTSLVEQRMSRMVYTLLPFSAFDRIICFCASPSSTLCTRRDL